MNHANRMAGMIAGCVMLLGVSGLGAQDWPQWRGPNRDAKATGFTAPKTWPRELTQKWKVPVGDGVATPALVGDKLYVFSREGSNEVVRCLAAATGKEIWQDKYPAQAATGPARSFPGPRSSPTVAEGKVVTLGVSGTLSCYDASSGKVLWRNQDYKGSVPGFFTSSSPIIVDNLCIAQVGSERNGVIVALDLANGKEKWKAAGGGTAYASPVLLNLGKTKLIVAETQQNIVAIGLADGKVLWQTPFAAARRGYNACTPIVDGQTVIFSGSGRGTKAVKLEQEGDKVVGKELWSNDNISVQFNTPVVTNGMVFGLTSGDSLFCINAGSGKTAWSSSVKGRRGYGSVVDAGGVLLALTPSSQLLVFQPIDKEFKQLASYKVADSPTYAYPIVAGNRVFVKDSDSLTLWTIE
jgi:outer membrane protein assembly factor BamB